MTAAKLSVIVISFNMAREIPRTIRSLSVHMQRDVRQKDYEIIVIDNGSTEPFDEATCRHWIPDLKIHRVRDASVSPVAAINKGLEIASGDLVGVMIDGARMASPGLLARALDASQLHDRPVIGSLGFHLGPDVQMNSVKNGYDQATEDELLARSGWEHDGYRLFDISVFAGSSRRGWFFLPAETNALFLRREHWHELGGYDPGFVTPGGGLANLDMWARACADPKGRIIMLLGEATFHQVHGGIATNATEPTWPRFHEEYVALRGRPYSLPVGNPLFVGQLHPSAVSSMRKSLEEFEAANRLA